MKVLITGAAGMLGQQVAKEFTGRGAQTYPLKRKDLDITRFHEVKEILGAIRPQLVVNCAAYTDVDRAENDRDAAFTVNGLGPRLLAAACRQYGAGLMHISTDYVFNGQSKRPYLISDPPDPINIYGASKLMGERGVRESGCSYYIIRTSWLFGPGGKNFVSTILKLAKEKDTIKVVNDQQGSPTYTPDLARAIADLAATGIYGAYHITNSGITTWYNFAQKIIETASLKTKIEPCSSIDFPRPAPRPTNSALDPFPLIQVLGQIPPGWEETVKQYLNMEEF